MSIQKQIKGKKYILLLLIGVLAFLPLLRYIAPSSMGRCIFCDIVSGQVPKTVIEVDTDEYVIFRDIRPSSTYHYLAVPKRHIENLRTLTKEDESLVINLHNGLKTFFTKENISTEDALFGFHLPPFITVKHLHMHGIAPRSTMSFVNRMMFKPGSPWFKTYNEAIEYLHSKA